jgi:hypothetical protein
LNRSRQFDCARSCGPHVRHRPSDGTRQFSGRAFEQARPSDNDIGEGARPTTFDGTVMARTRRAIPDDGLF